jgi:outer membrane receptor protein involved in Fe transport
MMKGLGMLVCCAVLMEAPAYAQAASVSGSVRDETGGALPGASVELRGLPGSPVFTATDSQGAYRFDHVAPGRYQIVFTLINFAPTRRDVEVSPGGARRVDAVLHLALNADVTVTGTRTFANLADADNPAENLVGIALAPSQGAVTARQLADRPLMRTGEVLETIPGVIVTQHSGEGKANQYFLRGFNLDHGTDFATTVAGTPVNMPTHAHGQGYSDLNFLIPELVTGVQFSKGPYYAEQGDFATAGAATINYANALDAPLARVDAGGQGYARAVFAASPRVGQGHLLAALEAGHDDGPWVHPDNYRKVTGVLRYSQGDAVNGFSMTAMGYHGDWSSSDQIAQRAVNSGLFGRFGAIDASDGGHSYRYSLAGDWQHGSGGTLTTVTAYGIGYDLALFSNFTYFLNDPINGDQIEQADHRFVSGVKVSHKRLSEWHGHAVQNTLGVQVRNDDIANVGLYHTRARVRLDTASQDTVVETGGAVYGQNEVQWTPWLRTMLGLRADAYRFRVTDELLAANSGTASAALVSPKGGVTLGPWKRTEFYVDAGDGLHSNDARGATIARSADGTPADRVTPLVRATGAEVGLRTVAIPHLQSTLAVWTLNLASELVFAGDVGATQASRPSHREGIEWATYYRPVRDLVFDVDCSWSRARFTDREPAAGQYIPEAVGTVISGGTTVEDFHHLFGSVRWRYFGPRALIENDSVESKATSLIDLQTGYRLTRQVKLALGVFNLLNARDSDIDYCYPSRLPGEPLGGVNDIHFHPTLPRTARINLIVGF